MKWNDLLKIVGKDPVFYSSLLKTGSIDLTDLGRQLSRWVKSGKLLQLRKGLYTLSPEYRKTSPHPFYIANKLVRGSYVSLQSALEYYGLIPEYVPNITSVTTGRPGTYSTPLGFFIYKHVKKSLFFDFTLVDMGESQQVFIARPEKALIDLLYLTPGADSLAYLEGLRLQNLDNLNINYLKELAEKTGSQKLKRAVRRFEIIIKEEK